MSFENRVVCKKDFFRSFVLNNSSEDNLFDTEQTTEEQTTGDQTTEGQTTEGQTTEGQTTEGQTTEGQTTEGQTTEGQTTEGQTTEGEQATEQAQPDVQTYQGKSLLPNILQVWTR